MGKAKQTVPPEQRRTSPRLALKPKAAPVETKKKAAPKKAPKAKKAKPAENGNTKVEEPKAKLKPLKPNK
nr:high mobility group nucleosomal binding domain 2 [Oryzias latipes]